MNTNNSNTSQAGIKDLAVRPKSLTPSVLGMANSHGVKLSLNMTSEDKKELMSKLEEWRKARKDKLAARILTKQKQFEKPKVPISALPPKSRPPSFLSDGASKIQDRQSVFERLYNNNKRKIKKPDISSTSSKPTLLPKPKAGQFSFTVSEKPNKPTQFSLGSGSNESNFFPMSRETGSVTGKESESFAIKAIAENSGGWYDFIPGNESESTLATTNADESIGVSKEKPLGTEGQTMIVPPEKSYKIENFQTGCHKTNKVLKSFTAEVPLKSIETKKRKNPLRRSVSMMFRQKSRNEYAVRRSFSAKNLREFNSGLGKLNRANVLAAPPPVADGARETKSEVASKSVSFVTPKHNSSGLSNLRNKLEDWLKVNGHSLEGYRHLRCFGIANCERSFPPTVVRPLDHSFEDSHCAIAPNTPVNDSDKENVTPPTAVCTVDPTDVENWLKELHRLIVELKYPLERCEEWLTAIRKRYSACSQLPIFWECLAALHESKGDLASAIEDYERAIIKGGEVDVVGDSLAQLFEKMVIEQRHHSKPKLERGIDPKNIFKSTIIKFALQQKALKKLSSELEPGVRQQLYVATPVRRSTRIQTPHKSSGEVPSLQTLTPELRKNVIFKPNESLLGGV